MRQGLAAAPPDASDTCRSRRHRLERAPRRVAGAGSARARPGTWRGSPARRSNTSRPCNRFADAWRYSPSSRRRDRSPCRQSWAYPYDYDALLTRRVPGRCSGMVDTLWQDVRYSVRLLRRSPLFTLTAALSLAIGIGANATIFSVATALLFRPLPGLSDPSRLVDIGRPRNGAGFDLTSYPNFQDIAARATTLAGV